MDIEINPSPQYNLNQGQKAAAEAFLEFLFSDDKEFIISGPAGVGKTYLMNYIVDNTMPRYHELCKLMGMAPIYTSVEMTATTNKAAEVLAKSTGRPTSTIHSFLALTVFEDFANGTAKLKKTNGWKVHENKILFVDECSMIDGDLYNVIHEGTNNCKIVFVGDHCQLAPVTEKLSPVYKQGSPFYELKEQMRNAGQPALQAICQQLRETVETGVFRPIQLVAYAIDHLDDATMQMGIEQVFGEQTLDHRILAYSNRRVNEYNDWIRKHRKLPTEFMAGENLVNNSAFRKNDRTLSVEADVEVYRNHGRDQVLVHTNRDGSPVMLEVDYLDIHNPVAGTFTHVPYPVDRPHFDALLKYFRQQKIWERYYHLKQNYPDLRPRDAATVHKSQGSTYESVFIDLGNISTCHQPDQAARLLYVAFSRAKSRVFLYGDLAPKYGGIIPYP